jgi:hypothetical protein
MAGEWKTREYENYLRLNQHNYYVWAIPTHAGLVEKNCWNAVDPGFDGVEELNAEQARTNRRALAHIFRHVNDEYLQDIGDCERARAAWLTLEEIHATYNCLERKLPFFCFESFNRCESFQTFLSLPEKLSALMLQPPPLHLLIYGSWSDPPSKLTARSSI